MPTRRGVFLTLTVYSVRSVYMYLVAILGIVRTHKYLGLHRNGDLIRAHSCGNKTNILAGSYCSKPYTTERETRNATFITSGSGPLQIPLVISRKYDPANHR